MIEHTNHLRSIAVEAAERAPELGVQQRTVASMARRSPRTLRRWKQQKHTSAKPLGRAVLRATPAQDEALRESFAELGSGTGVLVFQGEHPDMARRELRARVLHLRDEWREANASWVDRLGWTKSGAVWAVDHTHVPGKGFSIAIACRDLASHEQVLWQPSRETAHVTTSQLRAAFEEHGAPLVLKTDNGSAFMSHQVRELLDEYGVQLLPSPSYYPKYNGSCEAANRHMKRRTRHVATSNGRENAWESWDFELARLQANYTSRPWGPRRATPEQTWVGRGAISEQERQAFRESCGRLWEEIVEERELEPEQLEENYWARLVRRAVVRRALVERGLLNVQRRRIRPPIQAIRSANVS